MVGKVLVKFGVIYMWKELKFGFCPRASRHVECPSASQTHFSKTGITWSRKLEIARRFFALESRLKGLSFDIKIDHNFNMIILPLGLFSCLWVCKRALKEGFNLFYVKNTLRMCFGGVQRVLTHMCGFRAWHAGSNPQLLVEMVEGRETKILAEKWPSKCFKSLFTCDERDETWATSCVEAVSDDVALFLGAIVTKGLIY